MITEEYALTKKIQDILDVHEALWNREDSVTYNDQTVNTFTPAHEGFTSVILKNSDGKSFQWITQNLNKSSYGTTRIMRGRAQGEDHRITWIIDNIEAKFTYVGRIETVKYPDGKITAHVERYTGDDTEVLYTSDSNLRKVRSKY